MSKKEFKVLTTPYEKNAEEIPYSEYPRPNMKRQSYYTLNGKWAFSVTEGKTEVYSGEILVPFPPESKMSGVNKSFSKNAWLTYEKKFILPKDFFKGKVLLNFGAVDRFTRISLNGIPMGEHDGGYLPFTFNITEAIDVEGENTLKVEVYDDLDTDHPYGKQCYRRGGMWYTPISGIWQSVWLESVCENYIKDLRITTDEYSADIEVDGGEFEKTIILQTENGEQKYDFSGDHIKINIPSPKVWCPDDPHIYRFSVLSGADRVESYFGLRRLSIEARNKKSYICLNGKPLFFHGLLDQGYFSDGIYLPATPEGYKDDILRMRSLGFNTLRKHIKIEPQLFYYYCDIYGMIVFQDMVNNGKYNFLIDTALPTIGLKRGISHRATKKRREIFEVSAKDTVKLLYNHPSVCYYTVFNEGWGQYDADRIYGELKELDPTRIWDATSGWFKESMSDVESEHIYFKPIKIKSKGDRPIVLSEFGGYSYKINEHSFNLGDTYGYKNFDNAKSFEDGMVKLYLEQIVPAIDDGLCASILTQVSDVEDETNGLLTYDRQCLKIDRLTMKKLSEKIYQIFSLSVNEK